MKLTDDLFQLIHSMEKPERRYFKLSSLLYSGNKVYLKLFDAIAKQKEYDEGAIRKKFHGEKFIRQLTFTKHYLYTMILKAMQNYRSTVDSELHGYLQQIAFLFEKGLYKQCRKLLVRAKQMAVKYEKFPALSDLLQKEIELARAQSYIKQTEEDVTRIFQEMFDTDAKLKNLHEYSAVTSQLFIKRKKQGIPRTKNNLKVFENMMKHPLFKNEKKAMSVFAKCFYYTCHANYCELTRDSVNAKFYAEKQAKLFENSPLLIRDNPIPYLDALRNLISCRIDLREYKEALHDIENFRTVGHSCKSVKEITFFLTANMEMTLYGKTNETETGMKRANELLKEYQMFAGKCKDKYGEFLFFSNIAQINFYTGNYTVANIFLNKILNEQYDMRNDVYCFVQIFSLLVYFELGNQELMEYKVRAVYRFLLRRKRLYKFENIVLIFIKNKLSKINPAGKELPLAFKKLKEELKKTMNEPFEQKAMEYFDFIGWLESKIEGKPWVSVKSWGVNREKIFLEVKT